MITLAGRIGKPKSFGVRALWRSLQAAHRMVSAERHF
jgi:hypothetical protein